MCADNCEDPLPIVSWPSRTKLLDTLASSRGANTYDESRSVLDVPYFPGVCTAPWPTRHYFLQRLFPCTVVHVSIIKTACWMTAIRQEKSPSFVRSDNCRVKGGNCAELKGCPGRRERSVLRFLGPETSQLAQPGLLTSRNNKISGSESSHQSGLNAWAPQYSLLWF
jgi:hypothetical protein